jgi:hypothetical protein
MRRSYGPGVQYYSDAPQSDPIEEIEKDPVGEI